MESEISLADIFAPVEKNEKNVIRMIVTKQICLSGSNLRNSSIHTHLCQRNSQTSNTATAVAHRFASNISVFFHPLQNLLDGLVMACADIQLDRVHVIALRVDLIPPVETFRVEILADFGFVIDS